MSSSYGLSNSHSLLPEPRRALAWMACLTAFIAYGSLLPFEFISKDQSNASDLSFNALTFMYGGLADALTNVMLYVPVGFLLLLSLARKRSANETPFSKSGHIQEFLKEPQNSNSLTIYNAGSGIRARQVLGQLCVVAVAATLLSFLLEWGQTWSLGRVGSWNDVRCNVIGSLLGAIAAIALTGTRHRWTNEIRAWLTARPQESIVTAMAFALFVFHLLPFDVVRGTADLRQSFVRAEWTVDLVRTPPPDSPPFAALVHQVLTAAWFGVLGFLMLRAERKSASCELEVGLRIVIQGMGLIVVIEALQLFSRVHVFDVASMLLRMVALLFGVWLGRSARYWAHLSEQRWFPILGIGSAILLAGIVTIGECRHWPSLAAVSAVRVIDWPLESLWRLPTNYAVLEVVEAWAVYAPLTAFVWIALCKLPVVQTGQAWASSSAKSKGKSVVATVIVAATLIEWLHAATNGTPVFDLSEPVMAAVVSAMTLPIQPLLVPMLFPPAPMLAGAVPGVASLTIW